MRQGKTAPSGPAAPPARGRGRGWHAASEGVACRLGDGVCQHGQDVPLRIPEGVAVVARPGESFRGDGALLGAGAGLQRVEEREPDRLLQLHVAVEFDVGALPERIEVGALSGNESVLAGAPRFRQRRDHFVAERPMRASTRPGIGEELHQRQALAGFEVACDRDAADVWPALDETSVLEGPSARGVISTPSIWSS